MSGWSFFCLVAAAAGRSAEQESVGIIHNSRRDPNFLREQLTTRRDLEERLDQIEKILLVHDTQLQELFDKIRPLLLPPPVKPRKKIGFQAKEPRAKYGGKAKGS